MSLLKPQKVYVDESSGNGKRFFNVETKNLVISLWLQTFFKHCLGEGDKILVSTLLSIGDQGVYAVVVNYGSLVARLIFLPIEESLRNFFSKLLSATDLSPTDANLSVTVISTILRLYSYLGIFAVIFGPLCSPFLLKFLVSSLWFSTDAPKVLATYTCYVPFLAFNGVLEAFVQSVATASDIKHQGSVMILFSLSFAVAAYLLMVVHSLGATGLVYALMINMTMRIIWSVRWIESYFQEHTSLVLNDSWYWLRIACPRKLVFLCSALSVGVSYLYIGTVTTMIDLLKQCVVAGLLGLALMYSERGLLKNLNVIKQKKLKKKIN